MRTSYLKKRIDNPPMIGQVFRLPAIIAMSSPATKLSLWRKFKRWLNKVEVK